MKLYDVPNDIVIIIKDKDVKIPPFSKCVLQGAKLKFHYIDGMYSYCVDSSGDIVHPAAWTEVEIVQEA